MKIKNMSSYTKFTFFILAFLIIVVIGIGTSYVKAPPPPTGQQFYIKGGKANKYCTVNATNKHVQCLNDTPNGLASTFVVENMGNGTHAIKSTSTNQYCTDFGDRISCGSDKAQAWEKFHWVDQSGAKFSLTGPKSGAKKLYCADEGSRIKCNRSSAGAWETFTLEMAPSPANPSSASVSIKPPEGASVVCNDGTGMVYRFMNGKLHHYPNPDIAKSWNPSWDKNILTFSAEECATVPKGEPLKMANPLSLPEGPISLLGPGLNKYCGVNPSSNSIECNLDATTTGLSSFRFQSMGDGTYALKNNSTNKYCRDTGSGIVCDSAQPLTHEKFHVVKGSATNTFSLTGPKSGTKRLYCADEGTRIVCNRNRAGPGEIFKHEPFRIMSVTPTEGASVSCGDGKVYRYMNGNLHHYPTPDIASSWNSSWDKNILTLTAEACAKFPKGDPLKMANPMSVPEGPLSLRGGGRDNRYCGVDTSKNIQCNLEATENTDSQFFFESMGDGTYALKNKTTNQYCRDTGDQINCSSAQPLKHEKFHYVKGTSPNTFSLTGPKSGTKRRFCADEGNRVICNRERAGPGEIFTHDTFRIMPAPVKPSSATVPSPASVQPSVPQGSFSLRGGGVDNKYCGLDESNNIQCNLDTVNETSEFVVEDLGDGTYALKNKSTNQYCTDNGDNVRCSSDQVKSWEKFHWVNGTNPNTFSLTGPKSGRKRLYCADEGNRIVCNRQKAGPGEMFTHETYAPENTDSTTVDEDENPVVADGGGFWTSFFLLFASWFS